MYIKIIIIIILIISLLLLLTYREKKYILHYLIYSRLVNRPNAVFHLLPSTNDYHYNMY